MKAATIFLALFVEAPLFATAPVRAVYFFQQRVFIAAVCKKCYPTANKEALGPAAPRYLSPPDLGTPAHYLFALWNQVVAGKFSPGATKQSG